MFSSLCTGLQWGVHDTFLFVYFQEELKASTALVSYMVVVGSLSVFLSLFFINKIIDCIGTANAIFLHIIVEAGRMIAYSYIKETPPYFALGLAATGKSLSEALLFCRTWGEHVVYKNCSECRKQFLYTTCSPQV